MPGQARLGDALDAHCQAEADVVDEDGDPGDEDAGGGEADEPVKGGEGAAGQAHEAEEHKDGKQGDAGVGDAPGGGAEEDGGGLLLEGEGVEHAGAGEEGLVGRGPGRGYEHGVDDGGYGGQVGGLGGDDKGALGDGAAAAGEALVVAGDEHADDEDGEHVEEHDADKDVLAGGGDGLARVARLGAGHGDGLDAGKGEDGRRHDAPVAEEVSPAAVGDVLDERAGVLPVGEVEGGHAGHAAEVDDEPEDDEEDDEGNLEQGEEELDLAKDADEAEADGDGEDDKGDDPHGRVRAGGPKLKQHADGGDLGRDRQQVAVHEVPADGEAPGRVDKRLGVPHKRARHRQQRAHLAERKLHRAHHQPDRRVPEQRPERAARLHRAPEPQEQARANGPRDPEHRQVPLGEAPLEVALLCGRDEVRVVFRRRVAVIAAAAAAGEDAAVEGAAAAVRVRREERPAGAAHRHLHHGLGGLG